MPRLRTELDRTEEALSLLSNASNASSNDVLSTLCRLLDLANHHVQNVSRDKGRWKELRVRILIQQALVSESAYGVEKALHSIRMALNGIDADVGFGTRLRVQMLHGKYLMAAGKLDLALEVLMAVWKEAEGDSSHADVAAATAGNIATTVFNLKHFEEAMGWFERTVALFAHLGSIEKQALAVRGVGMCHSKLGNYSEAFERYSHAIALLEQRVPADVSVQLSIHESIGVDYLNLADVTHKQAHYKLAYQEFQLCLGLAEAHGFTAQRIVAMRNLGLVLAESHFRSHDLAKARETLEQCLELAKAEGLQLLEAQVLRDLSSLLETLGDFRSALQALRRWHAMEREMISARAEQRIADLELQLATAKAESQREIAERRATILQTEIAEQQKHISAVTMAIAQKNIALQTVRSRLRVLAEKCSDREIATQLKQLSSSLRLSEGAEEYWEQLESQLAMVHAGKIETLLRVHPNLTPTERKVCALVQHEMSTKDIAQLLGTEPRSIEKYRQRIRKKLKLEPTASLSAYIASL